MGWLWSVRWTDSRFSLPRPVPTEDITHQSHATSYLLTLTPGSNSRPHTSVKSPTRDEEKSPVLKQRAISSPTACGPHTSGCPAKRTDHKSFVPRDSIQKSPSGHVRNSKNGLVGMKKAGSTHLVKIPASPSTLGPLSMWAVHRELPQFRSISKELR